VNDHEFFRRSLPEFSPSPPPSPSKATWPLSLSSLRICKMHRDNLFLTMKPPLTCGQPTVLPHQKLFPPCPSPIHGEVADGSPKYRFELCSSPAPLPPPPQFRWWFFFYRHVSSCSDIFFFKLGISLPFAVSVKAVGCFFSLDGFEYPFEPFS